jgi:hypothetical protein
VTTGSAAAAPRAGRSWWREILDDRVLLVIVASYLLLAGWCGSSRLDTDEFRVIKEPYEMIGGDYTLGYLRNHEWSRALAAPVDPMRSSGPIGRCGRRSSPSGIVRRSPRRSVASDIRSPA